MTNTDTPSVSKLGFILEVAADDRDELGDKLYGPDDTEAQLWTLQEAGGYYGGGWDSLPENEEEYQAFHEDYLLAVHEGEAREWEEIQAEYETVNDLISDSVFSGHPVLFKTNGTNLGNPQEVTEVPHFGHGAAHCEKPYDACREAEDAGGVYRSFSTGDLVVAGDFDLASDGGAYRLRDDVQVSITSCHAYPNPGTTEREKVLFDKNDTVTVGGGK